MANELIINASLPETRIALMENGDIQELLIERASEKGIVGNIYKGKVTRVLPGMQAAFVDIGLEKAAFLYVDDVFVHSEIWEEEEGPSAQFNPLDEKTEDQSNEVSVAPSPSIILPVVVAAIDAVDAQTQEVQSDEVSAPLMSPEMEDIIDRVEDDSDDHESDEEEDEDEEPSDSVDMGPPPEGEDDSSGNEDPAPTGTVAPEASGDAQATADASGAAAPGRKKYRRGRRVTRFRKRGGESEVTVQPVQYPENYEQQVADSGDLGSDRSFLSQESALVSSAAAAAVEDPGARPEPIKSSTDESAVPAPVARTPGANESRPEFRATRARDRRIKMKPASRPVKAQVNIQDLLKEGQEVLVQVAKDPIATKGARLTCHISLPGRHLVCMPTIDHVGVSRRIERDEERRRLREYVERNRPRNLGFIVRTASGKQQSEKRIKQDIDYLTKLWTEIREKAATVTAPALVYEDLNSVLRAIRDWVTEEIDKVIVDSRYHYNDIQRFVSNFMPSLKQKVELYHGDVPIFDAYGISTELSRGLERKVWLKSGGYIVIDQAEALVAIDVNTGRYVGKKNLEDTILKTNLEAVQEVAYQLRLRNCGGIIIIDLIDMEKEENRYRVYRALEDALAQDRARPTILKISELGLIEMTRKRTRDTIIRTLCESCSHCEGKGFIKNKNTVAYEVMRQIEREGLERDAQKILVQAHPEVIDVLAIDEKETLDMLERRYRKQVYLQAVQDFHPEQFEVTVDKRAHAAPEKPRQNQNHRHSHHSQQPANPNKVRVEPVVKSQEEGVTPALGIAAPAPVIIPKALPLESAVLASDAQPTGAPIVITSSMNGNSNHGNQQPKDDNSDDFSEEDRLAFLRAQAAQDAALAKFNQEGGIPGRTPEGNSSMGGRSRPAGYAQNNANGMNRRNPGGMRGRRGGQQNNTAGGQGGTSQGNGRFQKRDNRFRTNRQASQYEMQQPKWVEPQTAEVVAHAEPADHSGPIGDPSLT